MKGNVMKRLMLWFLLAVLFLPTAPSWAADGDIDTTFGTNGKVTTAIGSGDDYAYALGIQSDGKIVAAGYSSDMVSGYSGRYYFALVRYNSNGTLDTTFGTGGKVTTPIGTGNDIVFALGIQSDGKIVVAGQTDVGADTHFALARYNTDGALDSTFGAGGIVTTDISDYNSARALAIQSDGKIVVAGYTSIGGYNDFTVVRYNTDGSLDSTFGIANSGIALADFGGDDYADALGIQSDGRIVVAGRSFGNDFAVVRFNDDGTLDTTFGAGGGVITAVGSYADRAYALGIQSDGKIVTAGYNEVDGALAEFALVRYTSNGTLDSTFGTNGIVTTEIVNASASAMRIQSDGKIVAAGRTSVGGGYDFALVRYNASGSLDTSFGTNGIVTTPIGGYTEYVGALSIQSDGKIVAAGNSHSGVNVDFAVVRYLAGAATPTPVITPSPTATPTPKLSPTPAFTPTPAQTPSPTPASTPSSEKGSISGDVIDKEGYPIESAKIKLKGKQTRVSKRTTSDEDGAFEFTDLSADTYTITATRKGYKKGKQVVPLGKGEDADIEIEMKKRYKNNLKLRNFNLL